MKLLVVTLTEGLTGICISAGLQQFENYAVCAFLRVVNITLQYQLLDESGILKHGRNENAPYFRIKRAFSERN